MVNPTHLRAYNDLRVAARSGNIEAIQRAIAAGANRYKKTQSPSLSAHSHSQATTATTRKEQAEIDLWRAVSVRQADDSHGIQRIDRAVLQGANIYKRDNDGNTFLLQVMMDGQCDDLNKTIDHLVSHYHLDIHATNHFGHTALMLAAFTGKTSVIRHLIKHYYVAINAQDKTNDTALHWAAYQHQEEAGLCLIELGANVTMTNDRGETPSKTNEKHGDSRLFNQLLACETQGLAHPAESSSSGPAATPTTSQYPSSATEPTEPWMMAVQGDDTVTLQQLMQSNNFHIRMKNSLGNTALHEASAFGHTKMIYFLMGHRAAIDAQNHLGQTPLHLAAIHGHFEAIHALVIQEANILAVDQAGLNVIELIKARPDYYHNDTWQSLVQYLEAISGYTASSTTSTPASSIPSSSTDIPSPHASTLFGHHASEVCTSSSSYSTAPLDANRLTGMKQHQPISSAPAVSLFSRSTSVPPSVASPSTTASVAQPSLSLVKTDEEYPAHLCCPIRADGELMDDPVINSEGHTYDRKNIEAWYIKSDRDPNTNLVVKDKTLTPNIAIRQAIALYRETHPEKASAVLKTIS